MSDVYRYFVLDTDLPDSDWESVTDMMENDSIERKHPLDILPDPSEALSPIQLQILDELEVDKGALDAGDFTVYSRQGTDIYLVSASEEIYVVGEEGYAGTRIPEIQYISKDSGTLEV